ncbi:hypothetical protein RV12_GL000615 [Enterococcus quebecensis]|nr:hypothetical protein RV12_GL000615 [Enterococcus quebecensis]
MESLNESTNQIKGLNSFESFHLFSSSLTFPKKKGEDK